ncbi:hypothetical protein Airi02_018240 [Actinoallomurus iriomotensis]|uniref:Transposase n=1 Tax=Actinoallomurus iriomotensis TaxID=478107 RepID=A0A9W6RXI7_9ACTN|nr:hypothetical protein Airi02_018240 [Actinoallomurus iriomotensis]
MARAHRKVAASRADFLHKTSARLIRDHDVIVIEDLNVKGMARNRQLAKAISDAGWGTFRSMLEYKAVRYGRHLIVIDRWYPISKTCSTCGGDVRHPGSSRVQSPLKQELQPARAGIPVR